MLKKLAFGAILFFLFTNCSSKSTDPGSEDLLADVPFGIYSNITFASGSLLSDVTGYVSPDGREYAIVGYLNAPSGVSIIDLTDPYQPVEVSRVKTVSGFDVKVWKNYLYTVNGGGNGLEGDILDISNPANPTQAGTFNTAHNILITDDGYMIAEVNGLKIYDLNPDPTQPQLIFDDQTPGGHDAAVVGNRLFDFHGGSSAPGFTRIYDFSDPQNIELLAQINDPAIQYHHIGAPTQDGNYLLICDELALGDIPDITVWDIRDLDNPEKVATINDTTATIHNLYIIGNYAYASYYTAGLKIFDVSDPLNITVARHFDTTEFLGEGYNFGGAFGVYPFAPENRIYVSDVTTGLWVFKFDPTITQ